MHERKALVRKYLIFAAVAALLSLSPALAQGVLNLAPADAFFAIAITEPQAVLDRTGQVRAEFERLDVAGKFAAAFGGVAGAAGDAGLHAPDAFGRLFSLAYQDAAFYVRPAGGEFPVAFAALARLSVASLASAEAILADLLAQARSEPGVRVAEQAEGAYGFWVLEDSSVGDLAIAVGSIVDTYVIASGADEYRAIVRRAGRTGAANLLANPAYQRVNGRLALGANFRIFVDWTAITTVVESLVTRGSIPREYRAASDRLTTLFSTLGAQGYALTVQSDGWLGESVLAVNPAGGDRALADLLTARGQGLPRAGELVPGEALSFSATSANTLPGFYEYLLELLTSVPDAPPDLNEFVASLFGLDLRGQVMAWQGSELATFTLASPQRGRAAPPTLNPLGELGFILAARNEAQARAGIDAIVQLAIELVAPPVTDAPRSRQAAPPPAPQQRVHGGVDYTFLDLGGFGVAYTLVRGYAVITTSEDAIRKVIDVSRGAAPSIYQSAGYGRLRGLLQPGANSVAYTDVPASLREAGEQIQMLLFLVPTLAALSGTELGVDFRTLNAAVSALDEFLEYLAGRAGGAIGSTTVSGDTLYQRSFTSFRW
jgi:hypothetical protein